MKLNKLSWKDVSIRQYLDIQSIISDESIKQENKVLEIIPIIWPLIDPNEIPMNDVFPYIEALNKLLSSEIKHSKIEHSYTLGQFGKCIVTPIDQMTLSQFIDFQTITQKQSDEGIIDILACCIVPFGSKYNDGTYDIIELKDEIAKMSITVAPTIIDFFVNRLKKLLKNFQLSLAKMIIQLPQVKMTTKLSLIWKIPQMSDQVDTLIWR